MLRFSRKIEYALIALSHLKKNEKLFFSAREISEKYLIPKELLAKVLQKQYVYVEYGPNGGYKIRNDILNIITLTEFVENIEGPLALVDCNISMDCVQYSNCNIRSPINKINENFRSFFNSISVREITS